MRSTASQPLLHDSRSNSPGVLSVNATTNGWISIRSRSAFGERGLLMHGHFVTRGRGRVGVLTPDGCRTQACRAFQLERWERRSHEQASPPPRPGLGSNDRADMAGLSCCWPARLVRLPILAQAVSASTARAQAELQPSSSAAFGNESRNRQAQAARRLRQEPTAPQLGDAVHQPPLYSSSRALRCSGVSLRISSMTC